ncbi:glycosyltransferase family 4 protein [Tannerella forsythia]|uniref:Glycosyltransferase, group 1 family protein n=1 Tax=Tannerella forsythia (strain ATCC 43037 / JCM 10827 / CCUG 21028 A / KCTC 5666 / FDC 338) TaxID=203275 RepID=G8UQP8_TANFA|nr:glycosyltransferase family 4 protein [Tannerella forsythia]AEW21088.1 glycosyltransferase, group 1 family protein [Tannerella forsythia 92A2]PDP72173.1 glycosyltransferase family 1 protein [Tannerella forsythia]
MKVLFVNPGITNYNHPVFERLANEGCELIMMLPKDDDGTIGAGVERAKNQHHSYRLILSPVVRRWYGKSALVDLKNTLIQSEPDILVICWPYFLQLYFDRVFMRLLKEKHIRLILHEIPFQVAPFKQLSYYKTHPVYNENMELQSVGLAFKLRALWTMHIRKFIYSRATASLNYTTLAYDILPSYGIKKESIFVRYNSTDTDTLFAIRKKIALLPPVLPPKIRILHIGRLVRWKRVDLLLEAYRKVADRYPESELVIIGNGPEKENLIRQSAALGLTDRTIFTGAIYDPLTLGQYMNESTVYVLAGMGGLSINDAMCFSLPVICSVCDGTEKDLVADGVNGYFFKEGDANDLADKISLILSDTDVAKRMGVAGSEVIQQKINIHTVTRRYMDAFNYAMKQ